MKKIGLIVSKGRFLEFSLEFIQNRIADLTVGCYHQFEHNHLKVYLNRWCIIKSKQLDSLKVGTHIGRRFLIFKFYLRVKPKRLAAMS